MTCCTSKQISSLPLADALTWFLHTVRINLTIVQAAGKEHCLFRTQHLSGFLIIYIVFILLSGANQGKYLLLQGVYCSISEYSFCPEELTT